MGTISSTATMIEQGRAVHVFPAATPSGAALPWINLQYYERITFFIAVNNATTVTGSAVTLQQATDTAGSGAKTLSFTTMWANADTDNSDYQVSTAVAVDTFTTTATDNANALYIIDLPATDLDTGNGFDCVKLGLASATATVISVVAQLWPPITASVTPSSIVD